MNDLPGSDSPQASSESRGVTSAGESAGELSSLTQSTIVGSLGLLSPRSADNHEYRSYEQSEIMIGDGLGLSGLKIHLQESGIFCPSIESLRGLLIKYGVDCNSWNAALTEKQIEEFIEVHIIRPLTSNRKIRIEFGSYEPNVHRIFNGLMRIEERIKGGYELVYLPGQLTYASDQDIETDFDQGIQRGFDEASMFVFVNLSKTPGTFYAPISILGKFLGLQDSLEVEQEQIISETDKLVLRVILNLPTLDTTTRNNISQYHTRNSTSVWGPLSKGRQVLPNIIIKLTRKEGVDRYDPELREKIEYLLEKYKKILEGPKVTQ